MTYSNKNHQKSILPSKIPSILPFISKYTPFEQKKIFIHLLFFIRYNSKLSISCHGKKYIYIKKKKRKTENTRIKIAQANVMTSRVKRSIDISKSLTITRQREKEREKNSDMEDQ